MRILFLAALVVVVGGLLYIRFAPHDATSLNVPVPGDESTDTARGALRVVSVDDNGFAIAIAYLEALPRTNRLVGRAEDGLVTFVTRSSVIGFPDYTTLEYRDGTLKAYARSRFGQSDLGVNRKRLEGLIAAIQ